MPELRMRIPRISRKTAIKLGVVLLFIVLVLILVLVVRVQDYIPAALEWFENHKIEGSFAFIGVYIVCTVLLIPASLLSIGAGAIFGLGVGILIVVIGAVIGQTIAFLVGRYLLRESVEKIVKKYPKWEVVDGALSEQAWKIIFLLRLSPIIPYNILNYALALSSSPFWHYFWASAVGIVPGTVLFVYLGTLAKSIADVANGKVKLDSTGWIVSIVVSGVLIVVVVIFSIRIGKKALQKKLDEQEGRAQNGDEEASTHSNQDASDAAPATERARLSTDGVGSEDFPVSNIAAITVATQRRVSTDPESGAQNVELAPQVNNGNPFMRKFSNSFNNLTKGLLDSFRKQGPTSDEPVVDTDDNPEPSTPETRKE